MVAPPELQAESASASMPAHREILNERTNAKTPEAARKDKGKSCFPVFVRRNIPRSADSLWYLTSYV
jgi:hypothetical protein